MVIIAEVNNPGKAHNKQVYAKEHTKAVQHYRLLLIFQSLYREPQLICMEDLESICKRKKNPTWRLPGNAYALILAKQNKHIQQYEYVFFIRQLDIYLLVTVV